MERDGAETEVPRRELEDGVSRFRRIATEETSSASRSCDAMHGKAGLLKAIKFLQVELSDTNFMEEAALDLVADIWKEGFDTVGGGDDGVEGRKSGEMPSWKNEDGTMMMQHPSLLHGVAGILHALLDFEHLLDDVHPNATKMVRTTVAKMNDRRKSSSPSNPKDSNEAVQFDSGSPAGHALLLTQMYRASHDRSYLTSARNIAETAILPRGLSKKGVRKTNLCTSHV